MRSTQNISNRYDGIYKQEIEECLNSREVFNVLESISRGEKMANRTFDKYLISISMEKLMRLNDYNACKELYELMKKQNKNSKDENNENVKYVTMLMLYVCTQFVNKYDFALSLFYYEIIPNLEAYCLSDINKLYSYIINSSTINNQYISGQIIIDKVMDTIMDTLTMNAILNFYLKFSNGNNNKLIKIFDDYKQHRDIYSYIIIINYYLKINDTENMLKHINEYINNELIEPFFNYKTLNSSKELYYNQHIRLKIPNAIILPIANYYSKHSKINNLLILIQCLLHNIDIIGKKTQQKRDIDLNTFIQPMDDNDEFLNKFIKQIDYNTIIYKRSLNNENNTFELSFVFETNKPDSQIWLSVLKCIGNCMENNYFSLKCNKTRWNLIDCIVSKMRKYEIDFHNNIFYGLCIHLCYNDLDKAMNFYHKMISIAQKKERNSIQGTQTFYQDINNLYVDDFEEMYQIILMENKQKNIDNIGLFKPTHKELYNLLNIGIKHHSDNLKRKQLFCLWWINELKRVNVKPTKAALQLIVNECHAYC